MMVLSSVQMLLTLLLMIKNRMINRQILCLYFFIFMLKKRCKTLKNLPLYIIYQNKSPPNLAIFSIHQNKSQPNLAIFSIRQFKSSPNIPFWPFTKFNPRQN